MDGPRGGLGVGLQLGEPTSVCVHRLGRVRPGVYPLAFLGGYAPKGWIQLRLQVFFFFFFVGSFSSSPHLFPPPRVYRLQFPLVRKYVSEDQYNSEAIDATRKGMDELRRQLAEMPFGEAVEKFGTPSFSVDAYQRFLGGDDPAW